MRRGRGRRRGEPAVRALRATGLGAGVRYGRELAEAGVAAEGVRLWRAHHRARANRVLWGLDRGGDVRGLVVAGARHGLARGVGAL